jgi:glutathione S-transferase
METPQRPLRLHRHPLSGHCHRVELLASMLGLPLERVDVDFATGEHKAPGFLRKSPLGQVPVLEDGDLVLPDSHAILVYLASRYDAAGTWLPRDPVGAAQVARWMAISAGQLVAGPASARASALFGQPFDFDRGREIGARVFGVLDDHVATRRFLLGDAPTIADLALYSYTAHAPEGGISLAPYERLRAWLRRIEGLPAFVPMPTTRTSVHA